MLRHSFLESRMQDAASAIHSPRNVLDRALNFLKHNWVRDFLFKSGPELDLAILTSKEHSQNAFSGQLTMTYTAERSMFSSMFLSYSNANWTFVPAYSIDGFTASILLKENKRVDSLPDRFFTPMQLMRFIRNDDTGDAFTVSVDKQSDTLEILIIFWESHEHRHRCVLKFPRAPAVKLFLSERPLNVSAIAALAFVFVHISEHRMCKKCNPFGIGEFCKCGIRTSLKRPRFILDRATSAENMLNHAGSFAGECTFEVISPVNGLFADSRMVFGGMEGGAMHGAIPRLLRWAISKSMADSVFSPTWLPSSFAFNLPQTSPTTAQALPHLRNPFNSRADYITSGRQSTSFGGHPSNNLDQFTCFNMAGDIALSHSSIGDASETLGIPGAIPTRKENISKVPPFSLGFTQTELPVSSDPRPRPKEITPCVMNPSVRAQTGAISASCPGDGAHAKSPVLPHVGGSVQVAQSLPSVPLGHFLPAISCASGSQPSLRPKEGDLNQKLMQRKLRNRESAARSNLKKQIRRKEIKAQMVIENAKIEKLRSRLEALREVNESLKRHLSEMSTNL